MDENKIHEMERMIGKSDLLSSLGKISLSSGSEKRDANPVPATFAFSFISPCGLLRLQRDRKLVKRPAQEGLSDTQAS